MHPGQTQKNLRIHSVGKRLHRLIKFFVAFLKEMLKKAKQEAHGPRLAHLSDSYYKYADVMQHFSNPIIALMKGSSFKQFLVLRNNIWAWQSLERDHLNKLSITFQQ